MISLQQGIPKEIKGLPDGVYRVETELLHGQTPPPAPQSLTVEGGRFQSLEFVSEKISAHHFYYQWESHQDGQEREYSVNSDVLRPIEFLGEEVPVYDNSAAQLLRKNYNIILSNEKSPWNYHLASKLLRAIESLPHKKLSKPAKFILDDQNSAEDIYFEWNHSQASATLNFNLFAHASKKMVKVEGKLGRFFSLDLFKALVSFFTREGKDSQAVKKILEEKFSVTVDIPNYSKLTGESSHNFQSFHSNELLSIIYTFAEMPQGYYKIPGLRYLVRRLNGHPHPLYPEAAAVAWPRGPEEDSYIEFMETAFNSGSKESIHRLILHEKAHFLWGNVFSDSLKKDWIKLGKWFPNENVSSGWSTSDNLHFVSPYAHHVNPNEDMAESLSYYILNPKKLLSRAPLKYRFIEQRIMSGYQYFSQIRSDLTFKVLNLFPDYDYPGKIRKVTVEAKGHGHQDKNVEVTIELTHREGIEDGAYLAFMRISSPQGTFQDVYLMPVKGNKHRLQGRLIIPHKAKSGYWTAENITIQDKAGNERNEGAVDYGFKLYINNKTEDLQKPQYISDSLNISSQKKRFQGKDIFQVSVNWQIKENEEMALHSPVYASLISLDHKDRYKIEKYGSFNKSNNMGQVKFNLTEYFPPGRYGVSYLMMEDRALNFGEQYFSDDPKHESIKFVRINPSNADYIKPVLDLKNISVQSTAQNPDAPDGQTLVKIHFRAKDDKSGLGLVYYKLRDPLGQVYQDYFIHKNTHTTFFEGEDPNVYQNYTIKKILPKGSPPGTWGVLEIILHDKANNIKTYNFAQLMHFKVKN